MSLDASTVWYADFAWVLAILSIAWALNWELVLPFSNHGEYRGGCIISNDPLNAYNNEWSRNKALNWDKARPIKISCCTYSLAPILGQTEEKQLIK